jgi:hypothetical protein
MQGDKLITYDNGQSWQGRTYDSMSDVIHRGYAIVEPAIYFDREMGYSYGDVKTIQIPLHRVYSIQE